MPLLTKRFAYIDESGTQDNQEIMTVALIVLEGGFSASRIHKEVRNNLFPHRDKAKRKGAVPLIQLHYTDMTEAHKETSGLVLARHKIDCFASCYYHEGSEKSHDSRFSIYTTLLNNCLYATLEFHEDILVAIGQQRGWNTYSKQLVKDLQNQVAEASGRRGFRKVKFELQSAAKPGIQIADYYAGSIRDYLLSFQNGTTAGAYELIEKQVREIKIHA